jgi:PAS domain S-box-containing protein
MSARETQNALSSREHELIELAASGLTDQAIANKLGISVATVGTYWGRVRIKIGPYSRTELVATVIRQEQEATLSQLRSENEHLFQTMIASRPVLEGGEWQEVLNDAPDAILIVTKDGAITYANTAAGELFGCHRDALLDFYIADLVPEELRSRHRGHIAEYTLHPDRRPMGEHMATPALRRDGTVIQIQATLSRITNSETLRVMCCLRKVED